MIQTDSSQGLHMRVAARSVQLVVILLSLVLGFEAIGSRDALAAGLPAADPISCPPNSSDPSLMSSTRCVAEMLRQVRSGLKSSCILDPRSASQNNPIYTPLECRGGFGVQAEAIAQARTLVRLNSTGLFGDAPAVGGISANAQWEVRYRRPTGGVGQPRTDIVLYDRTNASAPIEVIELKQRTASTSEAKAKTQLTAYVSSFPPGSANRPVIAHDFGAPGTWTDRFRVLVRDCTPGGSVKSRLINQYEVKNTSNAGLLMIYGPEPLITPCPGQGQPPLPPAIDTTNDDQVDEDINDHNKPPISMPRPGRDDDHNGKDDFWEKFLEDHPELDDLPAWPSPVPGVSGTVAMSALTAVALTALVGICVFSGFCEALLAGAVVAETGAISLGLVIGVLGAMVATLVGFGLLYGDPHLATLDRLGYDLQAVGEFHLVEIPDAGIDVQARFSATGPNASALTRVATDIDGTRVEIDADRTVRIDGAVTSIPVGEAVALGNGSSLVNSSRGYVLTWPGTGPRLTMYMDGRNIGFFMPPDNPAGAVRGLLGNHDGDPKNDLAERDGTPVATNAPSSVIHGRYADSWRISDEESLFTYGTGESTDTYTDRTAPQNVVTLADFSDAEVEAATATCQAADVQPGPQFEDCVYDVALTGDDSYAAGAAQVTDVITSADEQNFTTNGRLQVGFDNPVSPNFRATRYSNDPELGRTAGPLFDASGYRFYVRNIDRHNSLTLSADLYAFGPVQTDDKSQSVAVEVNGQQLGSIALDGGPAHLTDQLNGSIALVSQGVTSAGKPFAKYSISLNLGVVGESLDVQMLPSNFKGVFNTALGLDNFDLVLDTPAADIFSLPEPGYVGDPNMPNPGSGAGTLESRGAADLYHFDVPQASANQARVILLRNCSTTLTVTLTDHNSGQRLGRWPNVCQQIETPQLAQGSYDLTVTPYASRQSGTYAFDFLPKPEPRRITYNTDDLAEGTLSNTLNRDIYSFTIPATATSGQVFIDKRECTTDVFWTLTSRSNGRVYDRGACKWGDDFLIDVPPGDYDLTVGTGSLRGGTYSLQAFSLPVTPQVFNVSLPLDVHDQSPQSGAGNLETIRSADHYRFHVSTDAPMYLDWEQCPDASDYVTWNLESGGGQPVASGDCNDRIFDSLATGDYVLKISSGHDSRGRYVFQAWQRPVAPQQFNVTLPATIGVNQPTSGAGNLENQDSTDSYNFTLNSNKTAVYIDAINCSSPNLLNWQLVKDVAGQSIAVSNGTCADKQIRQLSNGTYRLVVTANIDHRGPYSMKIIAADIGNPTIAHAPIATAFYGRDLPLSVTTSCSTPAGCFARLYYRRTQPIDILNGGTITGGWVRQDLQAAPATGGTITWTGVIPGAFVTTTGVDYYLTAWDGDNRNEFPAAPALPLGAGGTLDQPVQHVTTIAPPLLSHIPPTYAIADTDLPVDLTASCSTGNCSARLHYRVSPPTNADYSLLVTGDTDWPTATMQLTGSRSLGDAGIALTYRATIPARYMDTRGVEYYFDVTDGHTRSYSPGSFFQGYAVPLDGQRTGHYTVHVLEPPHIVHAPVATSPYRQPISVSSTANCPASRTCTARLYYRTTTNSGDLLVDSAVTPKPFAEKPLTVARVGLPINGLISVTGTIPASVVDTRGVDYFFRVDDGSTTSWWPGTSQVQGYANVDGVRVAFQHVRVIDPPHIAPMPSPATPALQAYTVSALMSCATETCGLTLHWTDSINGTGTWQTAQMTPGATATATPLGPQKTYSFTIPASSVTTRGLSYWLDGYDGYVHAASPGTEYWGAYVPIDGQQVATFPVRVLEPPHVVHLPPLLMTKGQPLMLQATSNCSSPSCFATLFWSDQTGAARQATMTGARQTSGTAADAVLGATWRFTASIPAQDTAQPVTYSISVSDGYSADSTPSLTAYPLL